MIITRSPLRISLGGGGTDLPSYYQQHGGFCIAAAIDRYVYVTIHQHFMADLIVKYSKLERVARAADLEHPILREALGLLHIDGPGLEISSMADIQAGTGLGSSGSFTTALLKALHVYQHYVVDVRRVAEEACVVELERVGAPIGKQDQYIAAYGGLMALDFPMNGAGHILAMPVSLPIDVRYELEDHLLLFFTGQTRSASDVLKRQDPSRLDAVKGLGYQTSATLQEGDLEHFARLLTEQWYLKRDRCPDANNAQIDRWISQGLAHGALGGKLVGAGGGGFLLFYAEAKRSLRRVMRDAGLPEVRFRFDFEGTTVLAP